MSLPTELSPVDRPATVSWRRTLRLVPVVAAALVAAGLQVNPALAAYTPGIPSAVDPGTPTFTGSSTPVPTPPASYDPTQNTLQAIYDADVAAGGTSYWVDRVLARPYLSS